MAQGVANGAESLYLEAIDVDPQFANAYYNLGNLKLKTGTKDDATDLYKTAARLGSLPAQNALRRLGYKLHPSWWTWWFFNG